MPGFTFRYEVSSLGRFRRVATCNGTFVGRLVKGGTSANGYKKVDLWRDGRRVTMYVHTLMALAFLGKPPRGGKAALIDCNPDNLTVPNLCWRRAGKGSRRR